MPYKVGAKGSYGCDGYPAVKEGGEVMGCHKTRAEAAGQIYAINRSEGNIGKSMHDLKEGDMVMAGHEDEIHVGRIIHIMRDGMLGFPGSEYSIVASAEDPAILMQLFEMEDGGLEETEYFMGHKSSEVMAMPSLESNIGMDKSMHDKEKEEDVKKEYEGCGCPTCKELNVNCENCPVCKAEDMKDKPDATDAYDNSVGKSECCPEDVSKQAPCWDGHVQRGMKPGKNGKMVPNCVPAAKADDLWEDDDTVEYDTDSVSKAEGYSPPEGARSAARKAIKFKEDGKATGAGTAVGWTRAGQLARGETISLSTVKRMYSYFSRHEVDKKGKDWGNQANPSNGYIMWLAWGGDAGFSWSRGIVEREKKKTVWVGSAFSFRG